MKYLIAFLLAAACVLGLCILNPAAEPADAPQLIISPYMYDRSVDDPNNASDAAFSFEPLELGEVRLLAPTVGTDVDNLCFKLEYDGGVVELVSDYSDVQLSTPEGKERIRDDMSFNNRRFGAALRVSNSGYINAHPSSSSGGFALIGDDFAMSEGFDGREYYLTANAYDFSDEKSPVIVAKLRLVQLHDNHAGALDAKRSRFFSVELISYECSETFQMKYDGALSG